MKKLNLHTHTVASPDALITEAQIEQALADGVLDQIAITDHDEIKMAKRLAKKLFKKFGEGKIIIGQEVTLNDKTHLIGLFLNDFVPKGLSVVRTAQLIRSQKGIILAPHPFNPKHGIGKENLEKLAKLKLLDIIEVFNGWNYRNILNLSSRKSQNDQAFEFAKANKLAISAATDAHTHSNLDKAHTFIDELVTAENIIIKLTPANYDEARESMLVQKYNKIGFEQFRGGLKILGYLAKKKTPFIN